MKHNLIIVRHGESLGNRNPLMCKNDGLNFLTKRGVVQSELAGITLYDLNINIKYIVSSPYLRAKQTAISLIQSMNIDCNIEIIDGLKEKHSGGSIPKEEQETEEDVLIRVRKVIEKKLDLKLQNGNVLCISHYHTMLAFFSYYKINFKFYPMGLNAVPTIIYPNGGIRSLLGNEKITET